MHRDAQGVCVGGRGGHADPQTGERSWAATDYDRVEVVDRQPGVGERGDHVGGELFGVRAGVDGDALGEHVDTVRVDAAPHRR